MLLVRAAVRPGKKLGLQSAAKNLQWRRCPYWLRQTVPNRCSKQMTFGNKLLNVQMPRQCGYVDRMSQCWTDGNWTTTQQLNSVCMLTYSGNEASWSTDRVDVKSDATGALRYQRTLLQRVIDTFNAVVFYRQQKTTAQNTQPTNCSVLQCSSFNCRETLA